MGILTASTSVLSLERILSISIPLRLPREIKEAWLGLYCKLQSYTAKYLKDKL
jgi:hypothetical protein